MLCVLCFEANVILLVVDVEFFSISSVVRISCSAESTVDVILLVDDMKL